MGETASDDVAMVRPFSPEERARLTSGLAELLRADPRIDGVVLVGSLVHGGDAWSDIDLQVVVSDEADVSDVADSWGERSYAALPVLHHLAFALGEEECMLCLLLDTMLEVDLAFVPLAKLALYEPFRVLYDRSGALAAATPATWSLEPPDWTRPTGTLWHDVLHACTATRRSRPWRALFYIERIRTATLRLASQQRGHYAGELNYADDLPPELLETLRPTLVSSLESATLFAAVRAATRGFLLELRRVKPELADRLERPLLEYITTMSNGT
jgi:predicted nucleotidyltransferase